MQGLYRELLLAILDVLEDIERQFDQGCIQGNTSLSRPLKLIREAVDAGVEVLEKCTKKKLLKAVLFSQEYMGRLNESKAKIQDALNILPACGIVLQASIQSDIKGMNEAIKRLDSTLSNCPHDVAKAVKAEFQVGGQDIAERLFNLLKNERLVADWKDFQAQFDGFRLEQADFKRTKVTYDRDLIESVCALSLQEHCFINNETSRPQSLSKPSAKADPPQMFLCGIMHLAMEDPVILFENGITYDRQHLCRWLLENPNKDPTSAIIYDNPLSYVGATSVRAELMEHFGNSAYVKYDDSNFKVQYYQLWENMRQNRKTTKSSPATTNPTGLPHGVLCQTYQLVDELLYGYNKRKINQAEANVRLTWLGDDPIALAWRARLGTKGADGKAEASYLAERALQSGILGLVSDASFSPYAQCRLGDIYFDGLSVTKDDTKAQKWYQLAADQRHANAQYKLGKFFYVAQDYAEARKWFRLAAKKGHAIAQKRLGDLYYRGQGVAKAFAKARKWYQLAVDQGYSKAQKGLTKTTALAAAHNDATVKVVNKFVSDPLGATGVYTGGILQSTGMPHGTGRMQYTEPSGNVYEGDWCHGHWHGYGRVTHHNGTFYEGEHKMGVAITAT